MFKKTDERVVKNTSSGNQGRLNSILGDGSHINGNMQIQGSVRIDGEFDGVIAATETIVIGRTGFARADLEAREILVAGRVEGKLVGIDRVELQEGARVDGDVFSQGINISDGVTFNGSCNMEEQPKTTGTLDADLGREDDTEEIAQMKVVEGG